VALMNDCLQCGAHAEDLVGKHAAPLELLDDESGTVRVYGGGNDSSEEEGSDEEADEAEMGGGGALGAAAAGGEDGGGSDDCTLLSGRAWRRRREDAFARFEQTLVRVAGGAAAQLAAKMAEVLAPMLTPTALFGADGGGGAPPSTTVGGATQRGRNSTIGEGSGAALLLMRSQVSAHSPDDGKRRGKFSSAMEAEHTYRCEATGVIAQTLAEYLGEWGAACNDWAVGRLSGALGAALARGYLGAIFGIPAAQAHGWVPGSSSAGHARPPSQFAVFSDYEMLLRCLSGETHGEAVAADAVEWTAWGALVDDDDRPLPSERAAADSAGKLARRRVRARAATAALEPLMHMMQALSVSEAVLEDGAGAVDWFSGLARMYAPSLETPHLFAAVRAVLEMRCAAPHVAAAAAAAAAEGSGLSAAHAPPIPKPVVAAALAAMAASGEVADAALAIDASATSGGGGGGGGGGAAAVGRQGVLRALFPNAVPDFVTFRKKSAKQMTPKKPRWNKIGRGNKTGSSDL